MTRHLNDDADHCPRHDGDAARTGRFAVRLKLAVLAPCTLLVIWRRWREVGRQAVCEVAVKVLRPALPIVMVKLVVGAMAMLALATLLAMLAPTWW